MGRIKQRIKRYIGRLRTKRTRTKQIAKLYRTIDRNKVILEKGGSL